MKTLRIGTLLVNAAFLSLMLACEGGTAPSAPSAAATPRAGKISGSSSRAGMSAAAELEDQRTCTNATLEGAFGFVRTGGTSAGPLAAVGLVTYDGAGSWVTTATISRNGAYTFDAMSTGAYVVDADCTGKVLSNGLEIGLLTLVDGGKTVLVLSEAAGDAVSEVQKKVGQEGCNNASLEGAFGFVRSGMTSAGPLAAVGFVVEDGLGNDVGRQTTSRNGVFTTVPLADTYQVGADCQGKFFTNGQEFSRFVVVDRGNDVFFISERPGNTVTGDQRKVHSGHDEAAEH